MFAGELALNHLHASFQAHIVKTAELDMPSSEIGANLSCALHIHSYPDEKYFSKLLFRKGAYDKMVVLYSNGTIIWPKEPEPPMVIEYAQRMALEGKFRTSAELRSIFETVTSIKNK